MIKVDNYFHLWYNNINECGGGKGRLYYLTSCMRVRFDADIDIGIIDTGDVQGSIPCPHYNKRRIGQ